MIVVFIFCDPIFLVRDYDWRGFLLCNSQQLMMREMINVLSNKSMKKCVHKTMPQQPALLFGLPPMPPPLTYPKAHSL